MKDFFGENDPEIFLVVDLKKGRSRHGRPAFKYSLRPDQTSLKPDFQFHQFIVIHVKVDGVVIMRYLMEKKLL